MTYTNVLASLSDPNADADPRLLKGLDGNFYLYYPQGSYIAVFKSPDLVNWTAPLGTGTSNAVLKSSDISTPNGGFWAEGAFAFNGTYYLYYTLVQSGTKSIGVASSTSPLGPFQDRGFVITGDSSHAYRDPFVFQNPDTNKIFIYFSDGGQALFAQQLRSPVASPSNPEPIRVLSGSSKVQLLSLSDPDHQAWEYVDLEHPMVFYAPNASASHRFYLLYNGAGGALARYAIGYAYAYKPEGPYTRAPAGDSDTDPGTNPLVHQEPADAIYGPGSPGVVLDNASPSVRWLVYRIKTTSVESWSDRRTSIDELDRISGDKLVVKPTRGTSVSPGPIF